jgi:CYTH domain-containing protein
MTPKQIARLITEDGEVHKEYEKRIKLKSMPDGCHDMVKIKQGLLIDKPGVQLRVRELKDDGNITYTMTCKFFKKSDESEVEITKDMFNKLWPEVVKGSEMEKDRWKYEDWVIDDISVPEDKKGIVAEIETETETEDVDTPKEFQVLGDEK